MSFFSRNFKEIIIGIFLIAVVFLLLLWVLGASF